MIRKAKELSITPKEGGQPQDDKKHEMLDDPEFIKGVLKELNIDPNSGEGEIVIKQVEEEQSKKDAAKDNKKMDEEK